MNNSQQTISSRVFMLTSASTSDLGSNIQYHKLNPLFVFAVSLPVTFSPSSGNPTRDSIIDTSALRLLTERLFPCSRWDRAAKCIYRAGSRQLQEIVLHGVHVAAPTDVNVLQMSRLECVFWQTVIDLDAVGARGLHEEHHLVPFDFGLHELLRHFEVLGRPETG